MKDLVRKILKEYVEELDIVDNVIDVDECRVKYNKFKVEYGKMCYLNFSDISDIERIKNNIIDKKCQVITIFNSAGESFDIPSNEIRFTIKGNKPYISSSYFYREIYPQLNVNIKLVGGINSRNIRSALKLSFEGTENWSEDTVDMSEGVIGIPPTVGGNEWSVMNYFDTKKSVHDRLQGLISQDNNTNPEIIYGDEFSPGEDYSSAEYDELIIQWLSKVFKGDIHSDGLDSIKNLQKKSIESGEATENAAVEYIANNPEVIGLNSITETVKYEPGHKKDRWGGIDAEFYGNSSSPIGVQIKPLAKYDETKNKVSIGRSNANDYSNKKGVDYFVFFNERTNEVVVFKNSNYKRNSNSYIFADEPVYPNMLKKDINEGIKISKDERIKLTNNKNFLQVIPLTTDASCKYGATTKWCVSGKESNAFKGYQERCDTVGMIMIKDPKIQQVLNGSKFALNVYNGNIEIHNALGLMILYSDMDEFSKEYNFTDDLRDVITDFVNYHDNVCPDKKVFKGRAYKMLPSLFTDNDENEDNMEIDLSKRSSS